MGHKENVLFISVEAMHSRWGHVLPWRATLSKRSVSLWADTTITSLRLQLRWLAPAATTPPTHDAEAPRQALAMAAVRTTTAGTPRPVVHSAAGQAAGASDGHGGLNRAAMHLLQLLLLRPRVGLAVAPAGLAV
jgi:hypothetical protein